MRARAVRWPAWVLIVGVGVGAAAVRLLPLLTSGGLRSTQGYDDGVHLASAMAVLDGAVPYRDFVFVHPPGIIALMLPFAAAADVVGSDWALAAARLLTIVTAAAVAALIAYLLRPVGRAAQLVGGGLYAVWAAAAAAERTVMLEPYLNLGLLLSLMLLERRTTRATVVAGVVLGVTCSVKIWPVALCAAIALALAVDAPRRALWWVCGAAGGLLVWLVPTALLGGVRAYEEVVVAQVGRERGDDVVNRLAAMDGLGVLDGAIPQRAQAAVVAVVLVLLVLVGVRTRRWVWTAVLVTALAEILVAAPSFYHHYAAFAAPGACLLAGCGFALLRDRAGHRVADIGAVLTGLVLLAGATHDVAVPTLPVRELQAVASGPGCSWSNDPAVLLLSRAGTACAFVDGFGTGLVDGGDARDRMAIDLLRRSERVLLLRGPVGWAPSATVSSYITTHFRLHGDLGRVAVWVRSLPAGTG